MKTILKLSALAVVAPALVAGLVVTFRTGAVPEVGIRPELAAIGARTPVVVTAAAPGRGLADLRLELVQEDRVHLIAERAYQPLPAWGLTGQRTERDEIHAEVGRETIPDLQPGEAVLRVTAGRAGTWLRHPDPAVFEMQLPVRLHPPAQCPIN